MLLELRIRNLAVVEDAVIRFGPGLNAMTGSTGAGKSIILSAVELLSGARSRRSLVRAGASSLEVEGVFAVEPGMELRRTLGMAQGEREVSIKRELGADGRNRIWINGEEFARWVNNQRKPKVTNKLNEDEAYCLRCNQVSKLLSPQIQPIKGNLVLIKGTCANCGAVINRGAHRDRTPELS